MARYSKAQIEESKAELRRLCPPGTKVYCTLRHVSRSGLMRENLAARLEEGRTRLHYAAHALGWPLNDGRAHWALRVSGWGMDMGFHTVHSLSYAIHGHEDRGIDAKDAQTRGVPFTPRRGHFRAGYSLKHEWI